MFEYILNFNFFEFTALRGPKCKYWFTAGLLCDDFVSNYSRTKTEIASTIELFPQ